MHRKAAAVGRPPFWQRPSAARSPDARGQRTTRARR